mgnify:CR=1 FL=1
MKYRIISVGKIRESFYLEGVREYLKRLGPYTSIELIDGLEEKIGPRAGEKEIQAILQKEAEKIKRWLDKDEILVVLEGQVRSSEEMAWQLEKWNASGKSRVTFLLGAAHGLAAEIKQQAQESISLSRLTFPHQMAVLILAEQIYRGFKILKGEPYHR